VARAESTEALADALNQLKRRSGHSYEQIGNRAHLGRSTVHRYCSGQSVPASFGTIEQIAKVCGANRDELSKLYRLWERANSARSNAEPEPAPAPVAPAPAPVEPAPAPAEPDTASDVPGPEPESSDEPPAPKRRRWWLFAAAAAVVSVVVTYAYLPEGVSRTEIPARTQISAPNWTFNPGRVSPGFVGVTINSATGAMPTFPVGSVRLWDSKTRWQKLEPQRGRFDWRTLDKHLAGAEAANLPVVFVFGGAPGWAAPNGPLTPYNDDSRTSPPDDLADWERFVRALVTYSNGRIEAYELWDIGTPPFFNGSVETLVAMTRIASQVIREVDPTATIVCPGFTGLWDPDDQLTMQRFAEQGGYSYCDYGAVKLYPRNAADPPETMMALTREIDRTLGRARIGPKLWATGWGTEVTQQARVDPERAADYAVRYYLVALWRWYDRLFFYAWGGDRVPIVLQSVGFQPTKAGQFIGELRRWLADAQISSCGHGPEAGLPDNVWQCRFAKQGKPFLIRWTHEGTARMTPDPGTTTLRRLDGTSMPVNPTEPMEITGRPVLLELA
jgi:helix-turn-helix protein